MEEPQPADVDAEAQPDEEDDVPSRPGTESYERVSHYAIAAFVIASIGLWRYPGVAVRVLGFQGPVGWTEAADYIAPHTVPAGAALVSIYLAGRADDEIVMSDGRIGGSVYASAARLLSYLLVALIGLAVIALMVALTGGVDTRFFPR